MRTERIAIIGAGPAGCAAAVQCKRLGISPLLVDRTGNAGGSIANAHLIENYPGLDPLPGPEFAQRLAAHLARHGIPILRGEVTAVRSFLMGQGFVLHGDCGEIGASCVIASTGTDPVRLGTPGAREAEGTRLFYDVRGLLAAYKTPARVLVVGGGEAALDSALSVACVGARVRILVRAEKLRARGRLTDVVEHNPAIQITPRVTVRHIRCAESGIELEVTGPNGTGTEAADALLVAIGRRSNVGSLFPEPIIDSGKPDKTTVPGLFVAGDAASGSLGQVGMAVGDGLAAAMAAVAALSE